MDSREITISRAALSRALQPNEPRRRPVRQSSALDAAVVTEVTVTGPNLDAMLSGTQSTFPQGSMPSPGRHPPRPEGPTTGDEGMED